MPELETVAPGSPISVDAAGEAIYAGLLSREGTQDDSEKPESENETEEGDTETESEAETQEESVDEEAGSDEAAEEETEEAEPEVPETKARSRRLKLPDGSEHDVTEDEAYSGYLRQADYTRKTQMTAEEKKQAAAERKLAGEQRAKYDERLKLAEDALVVLMPKEPDWDRVRAEHPDEYPTLFTDFQRYKERLTAIKQERASLDQEAQAEEASSRNEYRKGEAEKILAAIPEWRDEGKRDAERIKLSKAARTYGFTEQEINSIDDSRTVLTLRKAMLYDELMAKQKKVKEQVKKTGAGPVKTAKPGTPTDRRPVNEATKAASRLVKSGSIEDAADALFHSLRARK